jgi:hypothetical protein
MDAGMIPRTKLPVLAVAAVLSACFDSDELRSGNDESESGAAETVTMYSDETAESSDDNWMAEDTGPFETTCRDAIDCLVICQTTLILNPQPEPDYGCFFDCDAGLSQEEAYKLIKLAECIGITCSTDPDADGPLVPECGPEPETSDTDCLICIAGNGQDPQPVGCEEEAAACE